MPVAQNAADSASALEKKRVSEADTCWYEPDTRACSIDWTMLSGVGGRSAAPGTGKNKTKFIFTFCSSWRVG